MEIKINGENMKNLLIVALALCSSAAFARPDVTKMTCRDAAGLVDEKGAVVLTTGPYLYDRFVANQSYCGSGEETKAAYVNTLDNNSCRIGYVCADREDGGNSVSVASKIRTCKEGMFGRADASNYYGSNGSDHTTEINVVCKAGKWVPANDVNWKAPVTRGAVKCKDGAISYYPERDRNESAGSITYVCKAGKWYRK